MKSPSDPWQPTRYTLIERLKDHSDDVSWTEFFERYGRLIFSLALRSGLTQIEAEEVVQDTVLSVAKKIHSFNPDPAIGSFKAWLCRLTEWRIKDQVRRRRPEERNREHAGSHEGAEGPTTATEERVPDPKGGGFESMWEAEWMEEVKRVALARLRKGANSKHYQIFQMHCLEGHSVEAVATAFEVPVGQVYLIKHRLLEYLREEANKLSKDLK